LAPLSHDLETIAAHVVVVRLLLILLLGLVAASWHVSLLVRLVSEEGALTFVAASKVTSILIASSVVVAASVATASYVAPS